MKRFVLLCFAVIFCLPSCIQRAIHQGNELDKEKLSLIQKGDSKFQVENVWGSPVVLDAFHPNRVKYIEQVKDKDKNEAYTRWVIVQYDAALRVQHIESFGF